ncbi:fimbrial protein [Escherichia coli]|uniref:F4 family fimbrial subunit n=1 Tax=Enterobacteriaceae TaxID=543 RepID=UPI00092DB059|nr:MULTISPECIES: fimbrial protein [Enterobacteriaceae]APL06741.1 fimbrial protein [Escherichia coli]APL16522.1 fimbrial protein [Escherichia coli]APL26045.1 fimbrial protein [Escherichia coli]APL31042.1 fimbrial protein [Escherichia coli]APL41002.1 fimbrial protein [Escherichia coli]
MRKMSLFLSIISFLPFCVLAWNTPGEDFSGELKLHGSVTNTRNPWVWKVGQGNKNLEVKYNRGINSGEQRSLLSLPAQTVVIGKTIMVTPAGHEGLSPRVTYGKGVANFSLVWTEPGIAEVTLPVIGENNDRVGTFVFRMQAVGVLRHVQNGQPIYAGLYDDLNTNGLSDENCVMKVSDISAALQNMFSGEGPSWLQAMAVTTTVGLSHFSDTSFRQVEGVYGAQTVAGSGELRLNGTIPGHWRVSLPISIEYQ